MLALFGKNFYPACTNKFGGFMAKPKSAEAEKKKKAYYSKKEKKAKEVKK
jgi:hypothetical protein